MRKLIAALVVLCVAAPAHAEWYRADSEHFVVYADDSEKEISQFTQMLEKFHSAMATVLQRSMEAPSPSNRVTIYAVGSQSEISKLIGSSSIAGFYIPRAGGSSAFVQDIRATNGELDFSMTVLLHEYAHHFQIGSNRNSLPVWMNEGSAEFFASAKFPRDGSVQIGRPANHRAAELYYAQDVPVKELLVRANSLPKGGRAKGDAFYGRSWALYHYLTFEESRRGQMADYVLRLIGGAGPMAAAEAAFGDIEVLQKDLDRYLKQRRLTSLVIAPDAITVGPVSLTRLSAGMGKMMPLIIRSKRGVDEEEANKLVVEARAVAAQYPQDAGVLAALAEAEYDSKNDDAAIAAADRALAIDPAVKDAYVQKGYALFRKAGEASNSDAAYAEAMKPFSALNRLEQDHPLPLLYYYRSFVERGEAPNENARHALERASDLAPFDHGLAMSAAMMQASEGKIELARYNLGPIANNPHGGGMAEQARVYIDFMATAEEGTPWWPKPEMEVVTAVNAAEVTSE